MVGQGVALCSEKVDTGTIAKEILVACQEKEVILLGESHQNPKSQKLFLSLVDDLASQGKRVFVGLEISREQQGNLDALLSDPGASNDRIILYHALDHKAYREMLTKLGFYARAGVDVRAVDATKEDKNRDVTMSRNIAAAVRSEKYDAVVMLVGNLHTIKKMRWHPDSGASSRYLAERLGDAGVDVCSVMQKFPVGKGTPVVFTGSSPKGAAIAMDVIRNTYHAEDMSGENVADIVVGW